MNELLGFGFKSFSRISNIRIWIRQFFSTNIIRIFESFSSNLEYLKHKKSYCRPKNPTKIWLKLCIWSDFLLSPQNLTIAGTLLYEFFEYAFSNPAFCFLFSTFMFNCNWNIRIIFKYLNLFRYLNIFESFLKSRIIFGFEIENFLIYK